MKQIFSVLICGIIYYSAIVSNAKAQVSLASMSSSKNSAIPALTVAAEDKTGGDGETTVSKDKLKETKANLKAAKANFKALKANFKATENFKKGFKDGPDVKWTVEADAICAQFNRDDVQTRVIYNKRGNWVHTINYCLESKMPKDIKSLIRSNYPDYNIVGMNEIKEGNMTFYVIYLEDETSYKQISMYDGQLGVYQQFEKQQK